MASLLGIPQELRNMFLYLVILSPATNTPHPHVSANFNRRPIPYCEHYVIQGFLLPTDDVAYMRPFASLLHTNKTIREQTVIQLELLQSKNAIKYEIDVLIANEKCWLPTWTRMPWKLAPVIPEVTLTFRACGSNLWGKQHHSGFLENCRGESIMNETFYTFFLWFLTGGVLPCGRLDTTPNLNPRYDCNIGVLRLDVTSSVLEENNILAPAGVSLRTLDPFPGQSLDRKLVVHPDSLAIWLKEEVHHLFYRGYLRGSLWSPVGKVVITCLGKEVALFDRSEHMSV